MTTQINPIFPRIPEQRDVFAGNQLVMEFRFEVEYREKFEQHCRWYRETAKKHQQEAEAMKKDTNIFSWFLR